MEPESAQPAAGEVFELGRDEIDDFLSRQLVGRIGCHHDGRTYVVPVIYAYDGDAFYVYSTEGRKVEMMRADPHVCFEVDEYEQRSGSWRSVIVDGVYEELEGVAAARALALLAARFAARAGRAARPRRGKPGSTVVAFRIRIERSSGRAIVR
jgi:nitroimidazol reductase NimA-like FMN-containing flavoprotein (pyridoxamine 5'-phosphate oxidase superfamily)